MLLGPTRENFGRVLIFLLGCITPGHAVPQQQAIGDGGPWLTPEFDKLVAVMMNRYKVPGLSIAIVDGNATYAKGYGIAVYPYERATPETLFYTGSTTKAFTAAAASLLVDDDSNFSTVQWTTPLNHFIRDDFVLSDSYWTDHVTLEDALSHRSGMPPNDLSYGGIGTTVRDIVRSFRHLPFTQEPRTTFQYCNMMYIAVSHAIETLTGQWLGAFLLERIWRPLGMGETFFSLQAARASGTPLAHGYAWDNETFELLPVSHMDFPEVSGAGDTISNVLDYSKWIRAVLNRDGPLSSAGFAEIFKPRTILPDLKNPLDKFSSYALGWLIPPSYQDVQAFQHDGGLEGFGTSVKLLPARSWGYVIMGNTAMTSNMVAAILGWDLVDRLLKVPLQERVDWDAKCQNELEEIKESKSFVKAQERLYPNSTTTRLPASLPLESYQGTYGHPAYQTFKFNLENSTLRATPDRTWHYNVTLEHITLEYFIARFDQQFLSFWTKAMFKVDATGCAHSLGVAIEPAMGQDMIWFERI